MKRIYFGIAILLACSSVQAQYKKASFLNKSGRTYDVGFTGRFLRGGGGTVPGIYYSFGRDKGRRVFHWFDMEILLPTKYKYNTYDKNNPEVAVTVTGKSKLSFLYRYNFACYLTNVEHSESKFKPFITAGVNIAALGGGSNGYEYLPYDSDPAKIVDDNPISFGGNAGVGSIYSFSDKIGIKIMAGYNLQTQVSPGNYYSNEYSLYKVLSSHPYVGVGIRFVMTGDAD